MFWTLTVEPGFSVATRTAPMMLIFVGATGLVFSPSFVLMLIGVIAVGLGCGADLPVSLATISEASDDSNRGKLVGLSQVLWYTGIIATYALQLVIGGMGALGGQIVFGHVALAALIVLLLRVPSRASGRRHGRSARPARRAIAPEPPASATSSGARISSSPS